MKSTSDRIDAACVWALLLVFLCSGCAVHTSPWRLPSLHGLGGGGEETTDPPTVDEPEEEAEEDEPSLLGTLLLYLPNRICDAVEIVRAGANIGFGLGIDLRATWLAQAVFIHDSSVGVGFQGFRHLPVCARLGHSAVGVGPIKTPNLGMLDWPVNDYDIRVELFAAVVGAHAAVDLAAIFDFVAGIFLFDPSEDDFVFGG